MHNQDCPESPGVVREVQPKGSLNSTNPEKVYSGQAWSEPFPEPLCTTKGMGSSDWLAWLSFMPAP